MKAKKGNGEARVVISPQEVCGMVTGKKRKKILVVGQSINRGVIKSFLYGHPYIVDTIDNSDDTEKFLTAGQAPDLVFVDLYIKLPGSNQRYYPGERFIFRMKKNPNLWATPVVLIADDLAYYPEKEQAQSFLRAPLQQDALLSMVKEKLAASEAEKKGSLFCEYPASQDTLNEQGKDNASSRIFYEQAFGQPKYA